MTIPTYPSPINIQTDIELEADISAALIDEFNRRESGFMNFRVGIDIDFFPNTYNIVLLNDVTGERPSILTQCKGIYIPERENLAAGEVPLCNLSLNIEEPPDYVIDNMIAADPRVIEAGVSVGVTIEQLAPLVPEETE